MNDRIDVTPAITPRATGGRLQLTLARTLAASCMIAVLALSSCQANRAASESPYSALGETLNEAGLDSLRRVLASNPPRYLGAGEPITLFAPADTAFALAREDTTAPAGFDWDTHSVAGQHYIHDLKHGTRLRTLAGNELEVLIDNDGVWVGTAKILNSDLSVDGKVIHVMNRHITGPRRIPEPAADADEDVDDEEQNG